MSKNAVLEIHPGIVLKGHLSMAKDVILTGKFEGDLQTLGCVTVAAGGAVVGSIDAGALVLEPGNLVQAKIKVGPPSHGKGSSEAKKIFGQADGKWSGRFKKLKELALGRK